MSTLDPESGPLYLYGVVPMAASVRRPDLGGIDDAPVEFVPHRGVAAAVTVVGTDRIRPTRNHLLAHERVVGVLHRSGPVLPIRFGTVVPDGRAVLDDLLTADDLDLADRLTALEGKDEYRLRARYRPDVVVRETVERDATIRTLRARIRAGAPAAGRSEQMRLGGLVMAAANEIRYQDGLSIEDVVSPHVVAIEALGAPSDDVAIHAALLVDRRAVGGLERSLERVGRRQADRLALELVGPLPPWDFSDLTPRGASWAC